MERALYGPDGFYVRAGAGPAAHFRTSAHASPLFAHALARLLARVDEALGHPGRLDVVDLGAGRGVLLATEWLDNVPVDVVEAGRYVLVDEAGEERLGPPVEPDDAAWLAAWWPDAERAEVGLPRDAAWASAVSALARGLAVAVDYGHFRTARPAFGTLTGFRGGRHVAPVPDGTCDLTAHVAWDAVAAASAAA